jgi:hypothetical protein
MFALVIAEFLNSALVTWPSYGMEGESFFNWML